MKRVNVLAIILAVMLSFSTLFGCKTESKDMRTVLPGEWFNYHWYVNVKNGDSGYNNPAHFYTFNEDGTCVIDQAGTVLEGTYEFIDNDTIVLTVSVSGNSVVKTYDIFEHVRNGVTELKLMNVDNYWTYTLEPMSNWHT